LHFVYIGLYAIKKTAPAVLKEGAPSAIFINHVMFFKPERCYSAEILFLDIQVNLECHSAGIIVNLLLTKKKFDLSKFKLNKLLLMRNFQK
jgi:hypothetical protein